MFRRLGFILLFFSLIYNIQGQNLVWENYFGWNSWDSYNSIIRYGNYYYLTGSSVETGGLVITKVNSLGDTVWHQGYPLTVGAIGISIEINHRNNLVIFEHTDGNSGILEVDTNGNVLWMQEYNTSIDENNGQMVLLPDGSAIFMGDRGDYGAGIVYPWAIRIDHNGDVLWDKTYTSIHKASGIHIAPMRNGGFIMSGRTGSVGNNQIFQIQIDINGDTLSTGKVFTGISDHDNFNARIIQTSDTGFVISGYINETPDTGFVMKTDSNFNNLWYKTRLLTYSKEAVELTDGSYTLIGRDNSRGTYLRYSKNGNVIANKDFKTIITQQNGLNFQSIEFDGKGDGIVVGSFDPGSPEDDQFYYAKIDSVGIPLPLNHNCNPPTIHSLTADWSGDTVILRDSSTVTLKYNQEVYKHWYFQGGTESFFDSVSFVLNQTQYPDTFWVALVVSDGIYCTDTLTINVYNNEILPNTLGVKEKNISSNHQEGLKIYPNPARDEFRVSGARQKQWRNVRLEVYDGLGRIQPAEFRIQDSGIVVNSAKLERGIYYLLLRNEEGLIGKGKVLLR